MGKYVRAFNLDQEVGSAIDSEAERLGPNKASALVNELLKEALARRRNDRLANKVILQVSEATASLIAVVITFWGVLLVLI